ncbi:hypothetical protein ACIBJF_33920 [Streptomyces sp. NPDC050743]|uniref:SCO2400 family protein n=1 Tax=Streptomyces sp. NPDC050743 TaxID=3365634 RepID=UPI0037BBF5A5
MDYCSSCRRHLNGALVCPGCGAYAPDIAPPRSASAVTAVRPAADDWFGATEAAAVPPADAEGTPPADVTDAPPAGQGRAARRRQLARWKKNKRRAAVATAVALVGGGLTLASLDRGNNDRAQAATAPDNRSMSLTDEPSAAPSDPASTPASPAARHRHTPTTPTARTPAVSAPQQQHSVAPAPRSAQSAGHPQTATVASHQDAPAVPASQAAPAAPQPRGTTPSTSGTSTDTNAGSSGTTAQQTPSTGTGSGGSSSSGTSTTPATGSTSHDQLCLVLVCLG